MKSFLVRGVPASIQQDSWWMDGLIQRLPNKPPQSPDTPAGTKRHRMERPLLLIALIALADVLLWGAAPGLSLVIFGMAVLLAAVALSDGRGWGGLILGALLFLPLLENMQALSVMFWVAGLAMGGVWIGLGGWQGLRRTALSSARLMFYGPVASIHDLSQMFSQGKNPKNLPEQLSRLTLGWALPVGLGLVFLSLLLEANPIANDWLENMQYLSFPDLSRVAFWAGAALMIWPFLRLSFLRQRLTPPERQHLIGPRRLPAILNPDAVRRSLILFNLLFAVQTVMDVTYLWGGTALPDGMTYATYAHRGAYPLLLTALLAGSFALIARPFTGVDTMLRVALMVWIGQTILLVASSLLRLELYIEVYGLTRLRMSAAIWMVLVATGLGLTFWQVLRHHSASWLLKRGFMLGLVTLYGAMFLSFDRTIARYNLTHEVTQDAYYLCNLGPAALPEIRRHAPDLCDTYSNMRAPLITDWREWGFRDWRVLRSLSAIKTGRFDQSGQATDTGERDWRTY